MLRGMARDPILETGCYAHHAEMGNLLSLNPKIHRLDTDAEVGGCLPNGERKLFASERDIWRSFMARTALGEVLSHALL